ncbi:MAG: sensor domain-containing diguanylate cyclase [Pseudomonadales bacterium]|nr:sensor domain-containing diguanylate cyclase [Pseudomonadales bacterium]
MKIDADKYRRLINVGLALSAEKDIDSLLERILQEAKAISHADAGTFYLVTEEHNLRFAILFNDQLGIAQGGKTGQPITLPEMVLHHDNGEPNLGNIATLVANRGETLAISDVYSEPGIDASGAKKFDKITGYRSCSFLTLPLKNFADETIAILQLINAKNSKGKVIPFPEEVIPLIEALASQASVALENRHLLDKQDKQRKDLEREVNERTEELQNALSRLSDAHMVLQELTTIDAVTGIRNRHYFDDMLAQEWGRAIRQKYPITLLLLDIDKFKKVNDTYGHLAGDESLAAVAKAIDSSFNRPSDVVARYGGEEFVVILPYVERSNAGRMAEQVRSCIERLSIHADGFEIKLTVSIGQVTLIPVDDMIPREIIARADQALYKAKSMGRNRVCTYSSRENSSHKNSSDENSTH